MEKMIGDFQRNSVVNELAQGMESANELQRNLKRDNTSREETCNFLLGKILTHYDNALSLLDHTSMLGNENPLRRPLRIDNSNSKPPKSRNQASKDVYKKRKMSARKNEEVRVCSANGHEGELNDGYNWRKYGQKDILGAIHPRAYYRCTHRYTQGCLATKKVQQMDKDPSIFEVIYKGKHSCIEERPKQNESEETILPVQTNAEPIALPLIAGSLLDTEKIDLLSFNYENIESNIFEEFGDLTGTTGSTPFLLSPETSESYFSMSGNFQANDNNGIGCSFFGGDSEFNEIISDTTSLPNFPLGGLDHEVDFGSHFFDASDYFYQSYV